MQEIVKRIIEEKGIFGEEEHYEIAEAIVWECVRLVPDSSKNLILKHFRIIHG